ncbi:MAG: hypothetical protein ACW99G_11330 [Candidatus Thorarchaeota archaeon]|jgi:hypothetical protein
MPISVYTSTITDPEDLRQGMKLVAQRGMRIENPAYSSVKVNKGDTLEFVKVRGVNNRAYSKISVMYKGKLYYTYDDYFREDHDDPIDGRDYPSGPYMLATSCIFDIASKLKEATDD